MKQDEEEEVTEVVEEEAAEVAEEDVEASVVWSLSRRPMFSLLSHRIRRSRRTEEHRCRRTNVQALHSLRGVRSLTPPQSYVPLHILLPSLFTSANPTHILSKERTHNRSHQRCLRSTASREAHAPVT